MSDIELTKEGILYGVIFREDWNEYEDDSNSTISSNQVVQFINDSAVYANEFYEI